MKQYLTCRTGLWGLLLLDVIWKKLPAGTNPEKTKVSFEMLAKDLWFIWWFFCLHFSLEKPRADMSALDPHCPTTALVIDQTLMSTEKEEIYLEMSNIFDRESSWQEMARHEYHVISCWSVNCPWVCGKALYYVIVNKITIDLIFENISYVYLFRAFHIHFPYSLSDTG